MLRELGCDQYQGYLFAPPLEAAAVPALLARGERAPSASLSGPPP
jgi:EAL domain-containing protein (putative c-di-GMP-specific phosphodiesterase class I)